jgi:hypothetical protein
MHTLAQPARFLTISWDFSLPYPEDDQRFTESSCKKSRGESIS